MAYNDMMKAQHYNLKRTDKAPKPRWTMKKKAQTIFEEETVLQAIEQIKANKKLVQKVSNVICSTLFKDYSKEYQEKIKSIAQEIRIQKLY